MRFYLIALIFLLSFRLNSQVNIQDSLALVDLYNATTGKGWAFDVNWLTKEPVSKWYGVQVDPFSGTRVIIIDLHDNILSGSIPASIGNLTALLALNLPNNNLSGTIPESIGNLKNLQVLKLWYNQITGPLPASIGNLKNLVYLLLNNNKINGAIPATVGDMTNLQNLQLFSNQLSDSIPSSIAGLPNLIWMKLYSNKLSGSIPPAIGNIKTLVYLDLSNNQLSGSIPSSLAQPPTLDYLNLSNNQLIGSLPDSIMKHPTIGQIDVSGNQLSGIIPAEIGGARNLVAVNLSNNQLIGSIPGSIGNLYHLEIVNLSHNLLNGTIPSSLGNIVQMYYLDLSNNQLTGSLPTSFENLTNIRYLSIANNQLSGAIPNNIGFATRGQVDSMFLHVENNRYTFKAIEQWAAMFKNYVGDFSYAPQATIPIFLEDTIASVSAGGTPANNTYKWFNNQTPISSKLSDSTYKFSSYGNYSAQITNSIANKLTLRTDTFYYNGLAAPKITYAGSTSLCDGDSIILSVNFNSGATYGWYKDFALISNANSSSYTVKTSGNYFVMVSTLAGSVTSDSVDVRVLPAIPTPFIVANSSVVFCAGQTSTLTSSAAIGNQWYRDGILINGATNQNLIANTSGTYTVRVSLSGCNSLSSEGFTITVYPVPSQPTISQLGAILKSSSLTGNQWFLNGVAIAGANDSTYSPTIAGQYSVQVTLMDCQSPMSASISYVITAVSSRDLEKNLVIFPVPVQDRLFIAYNNNRNKINVSMINVNGEDVFHGSFISKFEIDTKRFAKGIYVIRVMNTKTYEQLTKLIVRQ
jgi:Leucine-rich repeat (LRR) protein